MGNPRSFTTKFNARRDALEAFVKAGAGRSQSKRRKAMERAAAGRPSDLASQARLALADRRIQRALETISGSPAPVKKEG